MEFAKGASVYTMDGDKAGEIEKVVIDPSTNDVTHVVMEKGFLFTKDVVIPREKLAMADDERIVLSADVKDGDAFPPYKQTEYVSPQREYRPEPWPDRDIDPLYYYPPMPYTRAAYAPAVAEPAIRETKHNVPAGSIAIDNGTRVMTIDDEHAGDVINIFTDDDGNITHLLVSKGLLFTTERLIPMNWVTTLDNGSVQLRVREEVIEELPEFETS